MSEQGMGPVFTEYEYPQEGWQSYRRRSITTDAVRIDGPFTVETLEGPLKCPDGWLALDPKGNLYPIAADVFEELFDQDSGAGVEPPRPPDAAAETEQVEVEGHDPSVPAEGEDTQVQAEVEEQMIGYEDVGNLGDVIGSEQE